MYYVVRSNRQTVFYCAVDDGRACFYRISQIFEIVSCQLKKFPRPVDQIIPDILMRRNFSWKCSLILENHRRREWSREARTEI